MEENPLSTAVFLVLHIASLGVLATTFFAVGRKLTRSVDYANAWEEVGISCALGFGVTATLLFGLGLAHQLTRPKTLLLLVVIHIVSADVWGTTLRRITAWMSKAPRNAACGAFAVVVLTAPMVLMALYPPTQFDATLYHLPFATAFVDAGSLPFLENLRYPVFPQLQEMLFVLGFFLSGEIAAQMNQLLALLLTAIILIAWGSSMEAERAGFWSAALWLGNPLAVWLGGAAFADIGLTMFVTAAFFAWHRWSVSESTSWLVVSAAMVGFACASKYLGLFFLVLLLSFTLFIAIRSRGWRTAVIFSSVVLAVAGPWYARIIYFTGNPVFPYFANFFGWNAWSFKTSVYPAANSQSLAPFLGYQINEILAHLGFLLTAPYNAVFQRSVFHFQAPISPWYLILIPLLAYPSLRTRMGRWAAGIILIYGLFWIATIRDIRYVLPIIPLAGLALAVGAERWASRFSSGAALRTAFHCVVAISLVAPGWLYGWYKAARLGPPPTNPSARSEFLSRHVAGYDAISSLNGAFGSDYSVYGLFAANLRYFAGGEFLGDHFGPNNFAQIVPLLRDPQRLHTKLRSLGVDHLLVIPRKQAPGFADDEQFKRFFKVVARSDDFLLLQCRHSPLAVPR